MKYDKGWREINGPYPVRLPLVTRYRIKCEEIILFFLQVGQIIARSSGENPVYIANRAELIEETKLRIFRLTHGI